MPRKSKREIRRDVKNLKNDTSDGFQVSSSVVTITESMVDEQGNLTGAVNTTPEGATLLETKSDVVTVWSEHMD